MVSGKVTGAIGMMKAGLILGIAELFITTTAKHLGGIAVELVSVNPYVPKYFGPEKATHVRFSDDLLSIGI